MAAQRWLRVENLTPYSMSGEGGWGRSMYAMFEWACWGVLGSEVLLKVAKTWADWRWTRLYGSVCPSSFTGPGRCCASIVEGHA
jgi:hypothetical protein